MTSLSFEEVFGFYSTPQNECSCSKIEISYPSLAEVNDLYKKLIDICADPQALMELLSIQILNHVRSGSPDHYNNYELSQTLHPFFSILPYILTDRCIIAQVHQIQINVKDFLSPWQYFSFQCFYNYFHQILSSKIYTGQPRQWLITTIFDLLSQHKTIYANSIVSNVHIKDKQFKDRPNLHAIIHPDQTISIYSQNTCIKKGILQYEPNEEFPIHQIVEMNNKKEIIYKSRISFLDSYGEKITSDSADDFFKEGFQIYHLISV